MNRDEAKQKIRELAAQCMDLSQEHKINFLCMTDNVDNDERLSCSTHGNGRFLLSCREAIEEEIMEGMKEAAKMMVAKMGGVGEDGN